MSSVLDTSIYLNGVRLANYSDFDRDYEVNQSINVTLGGIMYTDFLNIRRTWVVTWSDLFRTDYDVIYGFFLSQYRNFAYPVLRVPAFDISVPVMIRLSGQKIKHNAVIIKDFSLYLTEQFAFS